VVKKFAANDNVAFGDVNLSEGSIPGNHNPGQGGWPTIRYYNSKTGPDGDSYKKKTSKAMCDELGDEDMMTSYVEEYANTSLCDVTTKNGCSEKAAGYVDKMMSKSREEVEKQLKRLEGMDPNAMNSELSSWLVMRKKILKSLLSKMSEGENSDKEL